MKELERLFEFKDEKYGDFQNKLTPNIERERFIGVRVPNVKIIAKDIMREGLPKDFFKDLPHYYYDENMLHGAMISLIKDYDECMVYLEEFLPYIDNWAVCDTLKPKVFSKNLNRLIDKIPSWINSDKSYTIRFGIEMLMNFYLDKEFKPEYLGFVKDIRSTEYYVNMMIAWYFATALSKQWDYAIKIIENKELDAWTHNKTIQKAIESYRISEEQKNYLRMLKV